MLEEIEAVDTAEGKDEVVLDDNQLVCLLTGDIKKNSNKEENLQSVIRMLNEEYGFDLADMERDFSILYIEPDTGKNKKQKVELAVFEKDAAHSQDNIIRICVVQDDKTKENDKKKGLVATLENTMGAVENCEFGLWANGLTYHYLQKEIDAFGNENFIDITNFPGEGETIADLERNDRPPVVPANDSLIKVFKRSHDYIYGNEGRKKDAFWQLLNLIFCKLYDEKRRFICAERGESYRRKFWVGVKEQNTEEGRKAVADRIKGIFEELKQDGTFSEVFEGNESIGLTDKGLAFIAGEIAKYSFLDASVDVKGLAYETIVSNTLKQEAGQFFTPRNIIKAMVEMLNPTEGQRVLDPACGSGGFLVMVLDHVRKQIARELFPNLDGPLLEEKYNSFEVNERVKKYAENSIFGFDFDPDLKKAARMNMVMAGDGHANIFHVNSLAYPNWENPVEMDKIQDSIDKSVKESRETGHEYVDARGKFDVIFTNPPFGAKVKVEKEIALHYELSKYSDAPEVLFIEACYNYLKPGGKMAIVLPDGILGNPNTFRVREWILDKYKILASVDLAVEAFLPQVGVQASLLFLQKKTSIERQLAQVQEEEYEVFMAIAEKLGKDRKGLPIYLRDDDGVDLLFEEVKEYLVSHKDGGKVVKKRKEKLKHLADDLPKISRAYLDFLNR
ncbi:N-6 DNA methylase [Pontibacter sp. BAB1700]|uniref:methylation-associated defense system DNA methyltransferase MAD2 n=1 Tax=Pontibacter sp. BAB1700 TaxID=1144253 RepID=UPI00026BDDAC|nr:N-6 DNA methylase [Pontibacter sp. BAB1700]EJF09510.1 N-6 DNA methylase [Pontibacter sp. BAB1700]